MKTKEQATPQKGYWTGQVLGEQLNPPLKQESNTSKTIGPYTGCGLGLVQEHDLTLIKLKVFANWQHVRGNLLYVHTKTLINKIN